MTIHLQAGRREGMGHLFRMLWLSQALRRQGIAVDWLLRGASAAAASLRRAGYRVTRYPAAASTLAAVQHYLAEVPVLPRVWIHDCLRVDRAVNAVIQQRRIALVTLDDQGDGLTSRDCVINAQPSFWHGVRLRTPAQLCQGPAYKVLHPDVARYHDRPKPIRPQGPFRVAVTFGGTDQHGVVFRVCEAMAWVRPTVEWHVFLGPLFAHRRRLASWRRRLAGRVRVRWHEGRWQVIPAFAGMDAALCSCGLTIFEMMGVGTPALAIANAPHEARNGRYFAAEGGCRFLGVHSRVTPRTMARAVNELLENVSARRRLSRRGKELVDGRGLARVTALVLQQLRAARE